MQSPVIPRLLFVLTFLTAALLLLLVILSPLVHNGDVRPHGWSRVLALFGHDATLRRTALASSLGLVVTALIFFRRTGAAPAEPRTSSTSRLPPPSNVAGA
jgi:hypothetical protein